MSENSFRALGVSPEVDQALAARNITSPFRIQSLVLADALAGTDVLGQVADRLRQDACLCAADRRADPVERSSPSALVLVPTRELALQVCDEIAAGRGAEEAERRNRLRRCAARRPGQARPRGRRRRCHAGPPAGSDRPPDALARARAHPRPRRGRPDARHGLQAAGRADPRARPRQPPDDALLGDARRRGSGACADVHAEPVAVTRPSCRRISSRARSTTSSSR